MMDFIGRFLFESAVRLGGKMVARMVVRLWSDRKTQCRDDNGVRRCIVLLRLVSAATRWRETGPFCVGAATHSRSTISETAACIARSASQVYPATATAAIAGDHASGRAALFPAVVAGVQLMRQML